MKISNSEPGGNATNIGRLSRTADAGTGESTRAVVQTLGPGAAHASGVRRGTMTFSVRSPGFPTRCSTLNSAASWAHVVLKPTEIFSVFVAEQNSGSSLPNAYISYGVSSRLALLEGPFAYLCDGTSKRRGNSRVRYATALTKILTAAGVLTDDKSVNARAGLFAAVSASALRRRQAE